MFHGRLYIKHESCNANTSNRRLYYICHRDYLTDIESTDFIELQHKSWQHVCFLSAPSVPQGVCSVPAGKNNVQSGTQAFE